MRNEVKTKMSNSSVEKFEPIEVKTKMSNSSVENSNQTK